MEYEINVLNSNDEKVGEIYFMEEYEQFLFKALDEPFTNDELIKISELLGILNNTKE